MIFVSFLLFISVCVIIYLSLDRVDSKKSDSTALQNQLNIFTQNLQECNQKSQNLTDQNIKLTAQYSELNRLYFMKQRESENLNKKLSEVLGNKEKEIKAARLDAVATSRAINRGLDVEEICPFLKGFRHNIKNLRMLSNPVDFVSFDGADSGNVTQITFVEIKSGGAVLTDRQKQIKKCIENKQVFWEEFRID